MPTSHTGLECVGRKMDALLANFHIKSEAGRDGASNSTTLEKLDTNLNVVLAG
jgi:hypothetical protein